MSSKFFGVLLIAAFLIFIEPTAAWFENCDHNVTLQANGSMYINSPYYPSKYPSGSSCRYVITAPIDYDINIQCQMNLDQGSSGCGNEYFYVESYGNRALQSAEYFCGAGYVQRKSVFRAVTIAYTSSSTNTGGFFSCQVTSAPQPCDCGWSVDTKIVGGVTANINEFPFMTALVHMPTSKVFCGGTIINHRTIMSAAHCFNVYSVASQIAAVVGEHDILTGAETPYTRIHLIQSIRKHENYNPSNNVNDIAILVTTTSIEWSRGVGPACLPFAYSFAQFDGLDVQIAGWGTQSYGGQQSTVLKKATTTVASNANCQPAVPGLVASQMCTYSPPRDSCQFDSGGPLIRKFQRLFVVGLISFGSGCGGTTPGINTRITSHLDWLRYYTGDEFCRKN